MIRIAPASQYGPLNPGFVVEVGDGYQVLIGPNNSGKSAILQLAFLNTMQTGGPDKVALVLPERGYVDPTAEAQGNTLTAFNSNLSNQVSGQILIHDQPGRIPVGSMAKLLLAHTNYRAQLTRLDDLLARLGFPKLILRASQTLFFEEVQAYFQGAGLRSLLPILAALTDDQIQYLFIDEPELSLEPRVQKALRDLLIEESSKRLICVATHSHLLLNRTDIGANIRVTREAGQVRTQPLRDEKDLYEVTFDLLGSDTQDLFFPGNYLIVEGASDQVICEKALRLLGVPWDRVKMLVAGGINNVDRRLSSVLNSLVPLVISDSPYKTKIVALIDRPRDINSPDAAKLVGLLGNRLVALDAPSLEAEIPATLYDAVGRNKDNDLAELARLSREDRESRKTEISNQVAAALTKELLAQLPKIELAVQKAAQTEPE
jgi:ABC-type molybdenum transport system ATPase subunit/photorepair protein PhrA